MLLDERLIERARLRFEDCCGRSPRRWRRSPACSIAGRAAAALALAAVRAVDDQPERAPFQRRGAALSDDPMPLTCGICTIPAASWRTVTSGLGSA